MQNWPKALIKPDTTILEMLKIIDIAEMRIAVVVDDQQKLLGIISDYDIRQSLLKNISFNEPVKHIMNTQPIVAEVKKSRQAMLNIIKCKSLIVLPIVDESRRIVNIETINEFIETPILDNYVVIMAGGLGTRLKPLTNHCPKPLLKIGEKPLLEIIIDNFIEYGLHNFFLSVNYKSHMIKDYFGDGSQWNINIRYLEEDSPLGTAGALSLLPEIPTEPLMVMNGDIMTQVNFQQFLEFHLSHADKATMGVRKYQNIIPYGVVKSEGQQLLSIQEKPVQNHFVNAGVYMLNPEVIDMIPAKSYYDMPTLFQMLLNKKENVNVFPIHEYWLDIGRIDDFERAHQDYPKIFL